ncbi:MAG: IS3 family transposase [Eubacteriales bacterium]
MKEANTAIYHENKSHYGYQRIIAEMRRRGFIISKRRCSG